MEKGMEIRALSFIQVGENMSAVEKTTDILEQESLLMKMVQNLWESLLRENDMVKELSSELMDIKFKGSGLMM